MTTRKAQGSEFREVLPFRVQTWYPRTCEYIEKGTGVAGEKKRIMCDISVVLYICAFIS